MRQMNIGQPNVWTKPTFRCGNPNASRWAKISVQTAVTRATSAAAATADGGIGSYLTTTYSKPRFAILGTLTGRRVNTLRAGVGMRF